MSLPPIIEEGDAYTVPTNHAELPPSAAVPMAIARIEDDSLAELSPLAGTVDPDALDELATCGAVAVSFTYEGHRVRIRDDGLRLEPAG